MRKKNTRLFPLVVSVFFALSLVGTLLYMGGGTAFASTHPSIHMVANLTVSAKAGKTAGSVVNPNIGSGSCSHNDYLGIYYNFGNNEACYSGNGYTGANLRNITILHTGNNCGWFLFYSSVFSGGDFETFNTGGQYGNGNDDWSGWPNSLITQIDIQGQNCQGSHA